MKENLHTQKCNTLSGIAAMKFTFPLFLTDGQFSIYREALLLLNPFIDTQKYIYISYLSHSIRDRFPRILKGKL